MENTGITSIGKSHFFIMILKDSYYKTEIAPEQAPEKRHSLKFEHPQIQTFFYLIVKTQTN